MNSEKLAPFQLGAENEQYGTVVFFGYMAGEMIRSCGCKPYLSCGCQFGGVCPRPNERPAYYVLTVRYEKEESGNIVTREEKRRYDHRTDALSQPMGEAQIVEVRGGE